MDGGRSSRGWSAPDRHSVAPGRPRRPRHMREEWRRFRADPQGQRFVRYWQRQHGRRSTRLRVLSVAIGLLLLGAGVALLFVPGPGILVMAFGLAALAGESLALASWLDRMEPRVRRMVAGAHDRWRRLHMAVKALALL